MCILQKSSEKSSGVLGLIKRIEGREDNER